MKAAVCVQFGQPLKIEDIEMAAPAGGQIKVRLAATAICGSDIHAIRGALSANTPLLAGHESAGYVAEVGAGVTALKAGDRVVISLVASCGHCLYCSGGLPHLCESEFPLKKHSPLHKRNGQSVENLAQVASFAEFALVDQSQAVKIPATIPMDRAALLGCGVITGFGAVVNRAKVETLSSVVVVGVGGVGLNSVQGAVLSGAYPIIAVDVSDSKLQTALSFGATHTVNARLGDAVTAVRNLTSGRGADYVFVSVGNTSSMEQGFQMSGRRGMTVLIGLPDPVDRMRLSPYDFIGPERVLTGCHMGSINLQVDIPKLIELYQSDKLKLDELISGHYRLSEINTAIASVEKGEAIRNIIMFE